MATALKAREAVAEATAAAEAEGIFAPTDAQKALIHRLKDLAARERAIKTEGDAIKRTLISEMNDVGARALAVNGKNLVLIVEKTADEVFYDQLELAEPELAAQYHAAKTAYEKAAEAFTFRVPATPARTFPGAR